MTETLRGLADVAGAYALLPAQRHPRVLSPGEHRMTAPKIGEDGRVAAPDRHWRMPLFEGLVIDDAPLRSLVYTLDALLIAAAVVTLVATALVSRRERIRDAAVLGTIGFTPGQLRRAFLHGQTAVAGIAAVIGIPAGLALFSIAYGLANGSSDGGATPSPASLVLVVPATMAVCAVVAIVPFLRRHPNIAADVSIE